MAVASLVLGIVSLALCLIPGMNIVIVIVAAVGLVLGAIAMRKHPEKKGLAVAGLSMSIIGLVLGIIVWVACASAAGSLSRMY